MTGGHAEARLTTADAQLLAAEVFGVRATAHALPSEFDDNFHLVTESGTGTVPP